ncbi:MAG: glycosyl hydrolase 53 family protein [Ginsengibacter sp.]
MKIKCAFVLILYIFLFFACKKSGETGGNPPALPPVDTTTKSFLVKGADISWLTEMEASGVKFYNKSGAEQDLLLVLKELGINTIRLRVWVNPPNNYNNEGDVLAKAIRAKNAGMKIMIDFHYSDTWADPGHQIKPAAWASQDIPTLQTSVYNHTLTVLNTLKANGVIPAWVSVGNETNDGMLWPEGKASTSMANFALLVNAGYGAVKAVDTSIKVIVHLSNGFDNNLFRWMFDGLKNNGARWDIIGMSLYPSASNWASVNTQCLANMNDMVVRYNKPAMICEVGMSWDDSTACKSFLTDLITKIKSITAGKGLGVLYWEPEAYNNWQGYTLGAFENSGKPTIALDAFK